MRKQTGRNHRWSLPFRSDYETVRTCTVCGLMKITKHESDLPWIEFWRDDLRVMTASTPPCLAQSEEKTMDNEKLKKGRGLWFFSDGVKLPAIVYKNNGDGTVDLIADNDGTVFSREGVKLADDSEPTGGDFAKVPPSDDLPDIDRIKRDERYKVDEPPADDAA